MMPNELQTSDANISDCSLSRQALKDAYLKVRQFSEKLCEPLAIEDYVIQSMPDVSPARWHLAHTTWFFETFILEREDKTHQLFHQRFKYLFNSYYNSVGDQHCRDRRGILSRPTVDEIYQYRAYVDEAMLKFLDTADEKTLETIHSVFEVGLNHEQQHQELMLMDIKHVFSCNPLKPIYKKSSSTEVASFIPLAWQSVPDRLHLVGHDGSSFAYDNEGPQHKVYLNAFKIANRLVTNGEYLEFIKDQGYQRPELWLSDGWATVQKKGWSAPLYWECVDQQWWLMTLSGMQKLNACEPVCHVSFYEADAYARWAGKRLAKEEEWEVVAQDQPIEGNFVDDEIYHPQAAHSLKPSMMQMYGDLWEWTSSPYVAYPGFKPVEGALGEYNGKFMCNQMVLRGGSCVTSKNHIRPTYRNFFMPESRWPFTGIRLAE